MSGFRTSAKGRTKSRSLGTSVVIRSADTELGPNIGKIWLSKARSSIEATGFDVVAPSAEHPCPAKTSVKKLILLQTKTSSTSTT